MDGTLIDSTEYHWQSWHDALAAENYELTYEQFTATYGQRNDKILRGYFGEDLPDSEIDRISEVKETDYRKMVRTQGIELLPGIGRWLETLKAQDWRQAVATSAPRANLETIIEVLGIGHYFTATFSAEDVQKGKPDPQVFLLAAQRLEVPPQRCIVVEDSPSGVEGGQRGGMRTIGVLTSQDDLQADWTVPTLDQLPDDAFDQLVPPEG
jgi:HAD superfamily hydrolase (TIGR01509 family)